MSRFAVIGLGRFGSRLAAALAAAGHEVIAIDRDRAVIDRIQDTVTLAVALDATDEQALLAQGVDQVAAAVVGIGGDFEAAALTTGLLAQIGVPRVVSRARTRTSARILAKIGATDVVSPEDEAADRWAVRLISPRILNHHELADGYGLAEVKVPATWVGQTLAGLDLRANSGLHVVAVKSAGPGVDRDAAGQPVRLRPPVPGEPLGAADVLVLLGRDDDLGRLPAAEGGEAES